MVDNTHADAEARKKFVEAARLCPKLRAVRCFVMAATMAQARYSHEMMHTFNLTSNGNLF